MKNALILHGTDFDKTRDQRKNNWFPWLEAELERRRYDVFLPELPKAWEPNAERYYEFLKDRFEFSAQSIMVGHSSGAAAILGVLQRLPNSICIDRAVLVAGFIKDRGWGCEGLFEPALDWSVIRRRAKRFIIIHSDDDPYCPLSDAELIANKLGTTVIVKKGQKHFSVSTYGKRYNKFPLLLEKIESLWM